MKKIFLLFVFWLLVNMTFAQISSPKIDSLVADALVKFKVAGASIAIVKDGKLIRSVTDRIKLIEFCHKMGISGT